MGIKKTETIDVMDSVGSNIRVDSYGWEVKRILPRLNNSINEEWISDKTRYACDGLLKQRLDRPYKRANGKLIQTSWEDVINILSNKIKDIKPDSIGAHAGDLLSMESLNSFKLFLENIGVKDFEFREKPFYVNPKNKINYIFNSTISGIEDSDCIILIGSNPRHEATMLNARIKKVSKLKKIPILSFGNPGDLTYEYEIVGSSTEDLNKFFKKDNKASKILLKSKKPIVIIGESALELKSGQFIFENVKKLLFENNFINDKWNSLNLLVQNASSVGAIDLGFLSIDDKNNFPFFEKLQRREFKLLYFLGSDNLEFQKQDEFVVYQGSHGDRIAQMADVILPSPAFTEQNGIYQNLEGRLQKSVKATYPPGEAKEDWKIFNILLKNIKDFELFKNFTSLRKDTINKVINHSEFDMTPMFKVVNDSSNNGDMFDEKIIINEIDYYFSNSIARSSKTMSDCRNISSKVLKNGTGN